MPTYDYACKGCGHRHERFEGIHDGGSKPCPKCGKRKARRMLGTGAGLIFKGAGFYTTDSKGGVKKGEGGDSKDSVKKDAEKAEKKEPAKEPVKEKKKEEKEQKK